MQEDRRIFERMQESPATSTIRKTTTNVGGLEQYSSYSFYQTFVSYSFKYHLIWVSGLLAFLPLFMNVSGNVEASIVAASLRNGSMYYESSILLVGFIGILAIDLSMDVYTSWFGDKMMNEKKAKFMVQRMTNAEKFLLLLGLLIQPIVAFLPRTIPNLAAIWLCCQRCRNVVVYGTIFMSWCRLYPDMWSPSSTSVALVIGDAGMLLLNFAQFFMCDPSVSIQSIGNKIYVIGQVLLYFSVAYFMIKALVWLYRAGRKLLRSSIVTKETFTTNKLPMATDKDKDNDESIYSFGYILFTWISLFLILVTVGGSNSLQLSPTGMLQNNIAYIITELSFINFHLRQVQYEAIINLCRLMEAKRAYVRYISHELRMPLNSAFLGLKMILDQLRGSEDLVDKERYETLWDVYCACMTAVDILVTPHTPSFTYIYMTPYRPSCLNSCMLPRRSILSYHCFCMINLLSYCSVPVQNDLMCYDKIESGILVLHKEDLTPLPFLQECFNGFRAEAQERGVILQFNPPSGDLPTFTLFHNNICILMKPPTRFHYSQKRK